MKGILFDKGVELQVNIDQESWTQGDQITGTIYLVSSEQQTVRLQLVYSLIKTIKDQSSWKVIQEQEIVCEKEASWSFQLETNSPISDKKGMLFLVYGLAGDRSSKLDLLLLVIF